MLDSIRDELLHHPEKIKEILEMYGYCHIVIRDKYMQFGRDANSSPKSIVIRLENNRYLYVHDYARNIQKDLFSYIIQQRGVSFPDVLRVVKNVLSIEDYDTFYKQKGIFGGFYNRVKKKISIQRKTYQEDILDQYKPCGNLRFLKDNISLQSQKYFNIRFDVVNQGIVIPIYSQAGELIGIKERFNHDVQNGEMKYFYQIPCAISHTLYGYSHNFQYLTGNTVYIYEAEKSVMQCFSYGIRNCVALGSGSISTQQIQMLLELHPCKIVFLHDVGYPIESILQNIDKVKRYSRFLDIPIGYWDYTCREYPDKVSPSDLGKDILFYILNNEIQYIGGSINENEIQDIE